MIAYLVVFLLSFIQSSFLSPLFSPGFLAPDLVLAFIFLNSIKEDKRVIFKAFFGGFMLDIFHDSLGLFMSVNVLSAYLMYMFYEKILIKRLSFVFGSLSVFVILNYSLKILLMNYKYSFEVNIFILTISVILTICSGFVTYLLVAKRDEQA